MSPVGAGATGTGHASVVSDTLDEGLPEVLFGHGTVRVVTVTRETSLSPAALTAWTR